MQYFRFFHTVERTLARIEALHLMPDVRRHSERDFDGKCLATNDLLDAHLE